MNLRRVILGVIAVVAITSSSFAEFGSFEDLTLSTSQYWNGSDGSGGFNSGGAYYTNDYNSTYASWNGWAYSKVYDTTTLDWTNQYSAITGTGFGGGGIYGVGFDPTASYYGTVPAVTLDTPQVLGEVYFTNTTYAYLAMENGYFSAKKFGGADGTDPDWFLLTITGKDDQGGVTGTAELYLADFRFEDPNDDFIIDEWTALDLSGLQAVKSLEFKLTSSDTDAMYGMNTPGYFAMDNVPEPATFMLLCFGGGWFLRKRKP